jgi:sodium/bile acid cotransporter 7
MAGGIPMATILFPGHAIGLIVLPLMLFHQAQLFVCATLARRYADRERDTSRPPATQLLDAHDPRRGQSESSAPIAS